MLSKLAIGVLFVLVATVSSCGGGGSGGGGGAAVVNADVAGVWIGNWTSVTHPGEGGNIDMTLNANADGDGLIDGSGCVVGQVVNATLNGQSITGSFTSATTSVTFSATISGPTDNLMNGTYLTTLAGVCTGDNGTISLVKQ